MKECFSPWVSESRASSCPVFWDHTFLHPCLADIAPHSPWPLVSCGTGVGEPKRETDKKKKKRLHNEALQVKVSFINNFLKKFCLTLVISSLLCLLNCTISQSGWTGIIKEELWESLHTDEKYKLVIITFKSDPPPYNAGPPLQPYLRIALHCA